MVHKTHVEQTNSFLNSLGNPGKYQIIVLILCFLNYLTLAFGHMAMAIYGWMPLHHCNLNNSTLLEIYNDSIFSSNSTTEENQCYITQISGVKSCRELNGWNYSRNRDYTSIVMEWDLVCDEKYLAPLATSLYFVGVLFGGLALGSFADKYGRRTALLLSFTGLLLFGTGIGLSQSFIAFVILRILQGFFMQGMQSGTYIIISETLAPDWRTTLNPVLHIAWGIGLAWMSLIAYIFKDWRYIQIALGVYHVFNLLTFLFIQESLRWLIASGKKERAIQIYGKICKCNHLQYSEVELMKCFETKEVNDKIDMSTYNVGLIDAIKTPVLRKRTLIMAYIWIATTTVYYGVSLKVYPLTEDKQINFLITGVLEIVVYVILIFAVKRFSRKSVYWCLYVPTAICCLIIGLVPGNTENGLDLTKLILAFAVLGRLFISGIFAVINIYVSELYPTILRTIGFGVCHAFSRFGAIIAPQLILLGSYTFDSLPTLLFSAVATGASLIVCFLPETFNKPLLDTIDEIENKTNRPNQKKSLSFTSNKNYCFRKRSTTNKHSLPEEQSLPLKQTSDLA